MKTTEEGRAHAIAWHMVRHFGLLPDAVAWIKERLTAYADERVREARAEALEEAAQMIEKTDDYGDSIQCWFDYLAKEIRALKDKP